MSNSTVSSTSVADAISSIAEATRHLMALDGTKRVTHPTATWPERFALRGEVEQTLAVLDRVAPLLFEFRSPGERDPHAVEWESALNDARSVLVALNHSV